jgi:hypothetical protein
MQVAAGRQAAGAGAAARNQTAQPNNGNPRLKNNAHHTAPTE